MQRYYTQTFWEKVQTLQEPVVREYHRQVLGWLAILDAAERRRMERLLQSASSGDFAGLALELFLSHYFTARGWPFERHPAIPCSRRSPDYRVDHPVTAFYVEASVGRDREDEQRQGELERELLDHLHAVCGPFHVAMTLLTPIPEGFPFETVSAWLQDELAMLDPLSLNDTRAIIFESPTRSPALGILFEVDPADDDRHVVRQINTTGTGVRAVTTHLSLFSVLSKKAYRYGVPDRPFVIAVGSHQQFPLTGVGVDRALFGDYVVHLPVPNAAASEPDPRRARTSRRPNGFFNSPNRSGEPRARQVSAVAVYRHALANGKSTNDLVIVHHPFAERPLPVEVFDDLPQFIVSARDEHGPRLTWRREPPDWITR